MVFNKRFFWLRVLKAFAWFVNRAITIAHLIRRLKATPSPTREGPDRRKSHVENSKIKSCTKPERLLLGGSWILRSKRLRESAWLKHFWSDLSVCKSQILHKQNFFKILCARRAPSTASGPPPSRGRLFRISSFGEIDKTKFFNRLYRQAEPSPTGEGPDRRKSHVENSKIKSCTKPERLLLHIIRSIM